MTRAAPAPKSSARTNGRLGIWGSILAIPLSLFAKECHHQSRKFWRRDVQPDGIQDEPSAMTPLDPAHVAVLRIRFGLATAAVAPGPARANGRRIPALPVPAGFRRRDPADSAGRGPAPAGPTLSRLGYKEGKEGDRDPPRPPDSPDAHDRPVRGCSISRRAGADPEAVRDRHHDLQCGTHGASVPLPGLVYADAEQLRDRIRAKMRQDLM